MLKLQKFKKTSVAEVYQLRLVMCYALIIMSLFHITLLYCLVVVSLRGEESSTASALDSSTSFNVCN